MGAEELKWRHLAHHQLMSQQGLILVHTVQLKPITFLRKNRLSGICDVDRFSILWENPSLEGDDDENDYYNDYE